MEGFAWGEVAQCCSGAFIEFFSDGGEVGLVLGYLGAFGEVVADQSACVLVAASLPGGVGVGEVDRHLGGHRECGMAGASRCPGPR